MLHIFCVAMDQGHRTVQKDAKIDDDNEIAFSFIIHNFYVSYSQKNKKWREWFITFTPILPK